MESSILNLLLMKGYDESIGNLVFSKISYSSLYSFSKALGPVPIPICLQKWIENSQQSEQSEKDEFYDEIYSVVGWIAIHELLFIDRLIVNLLINEPISNTTQEWINKNLKKCIFKIFGESCLEIVIKFLQMIDPNKDIYTSSEKLSEMSLIITVVLRNSDFRVFEHLINQYQNRNELDTERTCQQKFFQIEILIQKIFLLDKIKHLEFLAKIYPFFLAFKPNYTDLIKKCIKSKAFYCSRFLLNLLCNSKSPFLTKQQVFESLSNNEFIFKLVYDHFGCYEPYFNSPYRYFYLTNLNDFLFLERINANRIPKIHAKIIIENIFVVSFFKTD